MQAVGSTGFKGSGAPEPQRNTQQAGIKHRLRRQRQRGTWGSTTNCRIQQAGGRHQALAPKAAPAPHRTWIWYFCRSTPTRMPSSMSVGATWRAAAGRGGREAISSAGVCKKRGKAEGRGRRASVCVGSGQGRAANGSGHAAAAEKSRSRTSWQRWQQQPWCRCSRPRAQLRR